MPNEQQRQVWNHPNMGKEWPATEHISDVATPLIFEALDLQPGERVLDIACGGGRTTMLAAQAVGAGGAVTGVDISAGMIELAGQRAAEGGHDNVQLVVCDAQVDAFPGGPFDAVLSQFGIMFFEDHVAALANIRGQLRPGAKAAFVVWQPEDTIPWMPAQILQQFAPPSDEPDVAERAGSLGDPDFARRTLEAAGFANVRAELRNVDAEVSPDYAIPEALTVAMVPDERKEAARAALAEQRASFIDGDVARLFCRMVLLTAQAPA